MHVKPRFHGLKLDMTLTVIGYCSVLVLGGFLETGLRFSVAAFFQLTERDRNLFIIFYQIVWFGFTHQEFLNFFLHELDELVLFLNI